MGITINTNLSSMNLQNILSKTTNKLNQSVERMTTGYRVNRAADDAAALYVATGLSTRISSYEVGEDAVQTGINMLGIAEGAISLMNDCAMRIRDLAVQMANGVYDDDSRTAAQKEVDALIEEIYRQKAGCNFNGKKLLEDAEDTSSTSSTTNSSHLTEADFTDVTTETIEGVTFKTGTSKTDGKKYCLVEDINQLNSIGTNETLLGLNYVLMGDLDASSIANFTIIGGNDSSYNFHYYTGTFDGNGYAVENLKTSCSYRDYAGLFGETNNATIKNLGLKDCNVKGNYSVGGLVGGQFGGTIENCYVTGSVTGTQQDVGGLVGWLDNAATISNCYSKVNVQGDTAVGGLVGYLEDSETISNCYATGNVSGNMGVGGLTGPNSGHITNSYCLDTGDGAGEQKSAAWFASQEAVDTLNAGGDNWELLEGYDHPTLKTNSEEPDPEPEPTTTSGTRVQVGYDNSDNSCLYIDLSLTLGDIEVDLSSAESSAQAIETMDNLLKIFDDKRTEIGAMENRLQSVYESNVLSVENLSEAKSTIMDADMAEESSEYTKQQILQEAAASLLVQANQSPALALQLISGGI